MTVTEYQEEHETVFLFLREDDLDLVRRCNLESLHLLFGDSCVHFRFVFHEGDVGLLGTIRTSLKP